MPNPTINRYLH